MSQYIANLTVEVSLYSTVGEGFENSDSQSSQILMGKSHCDYYKHNIRSLNIEASTLYLLT